MKRIIIANNCLVGGGVENVLYNMVNYLKDRDYQITLSIPGCSKEEVWNLFGESVGLYPPIKPLKRIKRYTIPWFLDRTRYVVLQLIYVVPFLLQHYDVAIAVKEGKAMKKIAHLTAKTKIAWIHADFAFMHWTERFFSSREEERQCMMQFDKVVCVSQAAMNSVIKTVGDPGNLCVKYNPLNYREIQKKAAEVIPFNRGKDIPLFVSIGRLTYPKNYSLLIDVCAELAKKYQFELWIVGDGKDRESLEQKINTYGLDCVRLCGEQSNPYPYLNQADVFISSSTVESYGLAIQEALILGKPVIAISCPAIQETLDTRFGMLVDNDLNSLYTAMERMLHDKTLRLTYENNIRDFYKKEALYENRLQEICDLWES